MCVADGFRGGPGGLRGAVYNNKGGDLRVEDRVRGVGGNYKPHYRFPRPGPRGEFTVVEFSGGRPPPGSL